MVILAKSLNSSSYPRSWVDGTILAVAKAFLNLFNLPISIISH